jgi:hypothetical protein
VGIEDIDEVLSSFASSCFAAGKNCTLNAFTPNSVFNFTRPAALLQAIDTTLDALYAKPVPVYDLAVPSVVTASNLRTLLFQAMYSMARWPEYAERLAAVFNGNFTGLLNATMVKVNPEHAKRLDSSDFSVNVIFVRLSFIFSLILLICASVLRYETLRCQSWASNFPRTRRYRNPEPRQILASHG